MKTISKVLGITCVFFLIAFVWLFGPRMLIEEFERCSVSFNRVLDPYVAIDIFIPDDQPERPSAPARNLIIRTRLDEFGRYQVYHYRLSTAIDPPSPSRAPEYGYCEGQNGIYDGYDYEKVPKSPVSPDFDIDLNDLPRLDFSKLSQAWEQHPEHRATDPAPAESQMPENPKEEDLTEPTEHPKYLY